MYIISSNLKIISSFAKNIFAGKITLNNADEN